MKKIDLILVLFFVSNIHQIRQNHISPIFPDGRTYHVFLSVIIKGSPVYFVSPSGSDNNPGTYNMPWKTVGKAAQMAQLGDTVYIRDGIYNEAVSFNNSGTETKLIQFIAYPGENPIIDGLNNIPGQGSSLLNIFGDYIYLKGIEVRNSAYRGIYVYGNYDVIDNVFVHHSQAGGILISHGHHSTVENSRVWRTALHNEYGHGIGGGHGLTAARSGVTYATMRHNTVWETWGEGISTYESDHTVIEDNIVHDSFSTNIYISDTINVICQRNFVYMNPNSYLYGFGTNVGIMMGDEKYTPPSSNITVINNIVASNRVNFWWWQGVQGGGMDNVLIANNTFVNAIGDPTPGQGGVIISSGDHQSVRFENNLVWQDGDLPVIATIDQPDVFYSHNLWSKTPYDAASGPSDVIGDPMLAKIGDPYAPGWFRLTGLSPAIDKALLIPEIVDDYFGNPRDEFPDMGANEFIED